MQFWGNAEYALGWASIPEPTAVRARAISLAHRATTIRLSISTSKGYTHIISVFAIQVVVLPETDVGIGDNSGILQVVSRMTMWKKLVSDKEVSLFADDRSELFALSDIRDKLVERMVETFRMIV